MKGQWDAEGTRRSGGGQVKGGGQGEQPPVLTAARHPAPSPGRGAGLLVCRAQRRTGGGGIGAAAPRRPRRPRGRAREWPWGGGVCPERAGQGVSGEERRAAGGGVWDQNVCVPKTAPINTSVCKISFSPAMNSGGPRAGGGGVARPPPLFRRG